MHDGGQQQQPSAARTRQLRQEIKEELTAAAHESLFVGTLLAASARDSSSRLASTSSAPSLTSSGANHGGGPGGGDADTPTARAGFAVHSGALASSSSLASMPAASRDEGDSGGVNDASSTPPQHGASDTADPHRPGLEQQHQQHQLQPLLLPSSQQEEEEDDDDEDEEEAFPRLGEGEVICEVNNLYYGVEVPTPPEELLEGLPPGSAAAVAAPAAAAAQGNKRRILLNGVNCRICAGDMVAVIGASGAGKSTFLDLLAGKKTDGECAGQILLTRSSCRGRGGVGGWVRGNRSKDRRAAVYVPQDDFHVAELTVRESLAFAVRLGMGGDHVTDEDREARVDELLGVLGLEGCSEVRVGNPLERGISGGEARRLSMGIGVADLESVRLLLLDEPTTGLDSSSASEVMLLARKLAFPGDRRAVVSSVHQPSQEMFSLFDKVLVLVEGRQAFFGSASKAVKILSRPDLGMLPSRGQNPADFILLAAKAAMTAAAAAEAGERDLDSPGRPGQYFFPGGGGGGGGIDVGLDGGGGGGGRGAGVELSSPGLSLSYSCSSFASSSDFSSRVCPLIGVDPSSLQALGDGGDSMVGDPRLFGDEEEGLLAYEPPATPERGSAADGSDDGSGGEGDGSDYYRMRTVEGDSTKQELLRRRAWGAGGGGGSEAYAVGFWAQVAALWWRGWTVQMRRKDALWAMLVKNVLVGVLTATVFWKEGAMGRGDALIDPVVGDVTPAASNLLGILYFGTLYGLTGHLQAIPEIFEWKRHLERERAAGMYSTTVYWLVSSTVNLPVILAGYVVYLNVCYWPLGLPAEFVKFMVFATINFMAALIGYSLAQTLSAAMDTPQGAFAMWPLVFVAAANFAGFTIRLPVVRVWFTWLAELSFCRWIYQLMVVNEFGDFDEGPALLDLYFGGHRPSLPLNALYVGMFYATSLLLALFFLQPRASRLKVLKENPTLLSKERLSVAALGGRDEPGAPRPSRSAPPQTSSSKLPPPRPPVPVPPPQQSQEQKEQMQRLQEKTTAALQPEAVNSDAKTREYYSAFETASAGIGAVVTGGGGGIFKRGGWPGGFVHGLRDTHRGEEVKEAGRGGGGAIMTGRMRKSSRASSLFVETFDADGNDGDGPLYYLDERSKRGSRSVSTVSTPTAGSAMVNSAALAVDNEAGAADPRYGSADDDDIDPEIEAPDPLRAPLLGRFDNKGGNIESVQEAEVQQGSRVVFSNLHYYVFLHGGGEGSKRTKRGGVVLGQAPTEQTSPTPAASRKEEAHVLRGVTGVVSPGQIMAIMGPSGSGKTTLLDLLGGRKTKSAGRQEGTIIVDGELGSGGGANSAYVMQDNVHHGALTVRQTLDFAAKLRMSSTATERDRDRRVAAMVTMLGLGGVLDTMVGDESKRGISGGEAKRLSIAVEAMDLPGLLLLDEATSGLDATTALEVITAVRGLADLGRTVVVSLHQPSSEMFELFDTCLLLARGGYPAYFGKANRAMAYFASIGLSPPPSPTCSAASAASGPNPADYLLSLLAASSAGDKEDRVLLDDEDVGIGNVGINSGRPGAGSAGLSFSAGASTGGDGGGPEKEDDEDEDRAESYSSISIDTASGRPAVTPAQLGRAYYESAASVGIREGVEREAAEAVGAHRRERERGGRRWRRRRRRRRRRKDYSMVWLSVVLTHRQLTTTWQDRPRIIQAVARHAFIGIFYGALWWRLGLGRISERVGLVFFSLVFVTLGNQQNIPKIFQDRLLFYRERGAGIYGASPYWWSIVFGQLPLAMLTTTVYSTLVYIMAGLNTNGFQYGYFVLVMVLCNLIALSLCQTLAAATRLQDTAVALFPVFLFFFLAFGGFIVRLPTLPGYLSSWAPPISFVRWAMEGMVINEFEGHEAAIFPVPRGMPTTPTVIYRSFLDAYGYGERDDRTDVLAQVVWILLGNLVLFRLLTLACLKYVTFERR
eukprot:g15131.t1